MTPEARPFHADQCRDEDAAALAGYAVRKMPAWREKLFLDAEGTPFLRWDTGEDPIVAMIYAGEIVVGDASLHTHVCVGAAELHPYTDAQQARLDQVSDAVDRGEQSEDALHRVHMGIAIEQLEMIVKQMQQG